MADKEMKEIQQYWKNKYPNIEVVLYSNSDYTRYFGKIMTHNSTLEFHSDTLGDLISQGEILLRKSCI